MAATSLKKMPTQEAAVNESTRKGKGKATIKDINTRDLDICPICMKSFQKIWAIG